MPIMAWAVDQYFFHLSIALERNPHYWNVIVIRIAPLPVPTEVMQVSLVKVTQLLSFYAILKIVYEFK